jgi:hypothetical protein
LKSATLSTPSTTTSLVNHELPMPIFPCRLNNPQIPIGPVVIARDQPHAVAIPLDADAGAVFWPMSDMPF